MRILVLVILVAVSSCSPRAVTESPAVNTKKVAITQNVNFEVKPIQYPTTRQDDVSDNYHGTVVNDPYRWLEDDNSEETVDWVKRQNVVTSNYLQQIPYRKEQK